MVRILRPRNMHVHLGACAHVTIQPSQNKTSTGACLYIRKLVIQKSMYNPENILFDRKYRVQVDRVCYHEVVDGDYTGGATGNMDYCF